MTLYPCPRPDSRRRRPRGFSLIELLTVIAVIGILGAILFPVMGGIMGKARQTTSAANLSAIGKALNLYAQNNSGYLPAVQAGGTGVTANPYSGSWLLELVPLLEGGYQKTGNSIAVTKWPDVLSCPEYVAREGGIVNPDLRGYGMMVYPFRPDYKHPERQNREMASTRMKLDQLPFPSNNVIVGTSNDVSLRPNEAGFFGGTGSNAPNGDSSRFNGIGVYLFVDGSVRPLPPEEAARYLRIQSAPGTN